VTWPGLVSCTAQPDSSRGPFKYGGQFWLIGGDGVPSDAFAAMGHRGQYLVIIPSRQTVIVRRGYDESGGGRFDIAAFTRDVSRALDAAKAQMAAAKVAEQEATQAAYEEELAAYNEEYGDKKKRPKGEGVRTLTPLGRAARD